MLGSGFMPGRRLVIPTRCPPLDRLLEGGFPAGSLSLVYGEAETGKTTLALQCSVNCVRMGFKAIYVDCEGGFSVERLAQLAAFDWEEVSPSIILIQPTSFRQQAHVVDHLDQYVDGRVGLVVVDTITSLYRVELGESESAFALNRELNRQIAALTRLAKDFKLVVMMTSQVHGVPTERGYEVLPVATRVLKFWSDIVLRLEAAGRVQVRRAVLEKHPHRRGRLLCHFRLSQDGMRGVEDWS